MTNRQLQSFYVSAVLPQFGIENNHVAWEASKRLGPDEVAFRFKAAGQRYILIFEDYFGLGRGESFIEEQLGLREGQYSFILPTSGELEEKLPSYVGFKMRVPYKYCEGVTGTFTLLRLVVIDNAEGDSAQNKKDQARY